MGHQLLCTSCSNTAPTATSDASVTNLVRACGFGNANVVTFARASLRLSKAFCSTFFHISIGIVFFEFFFGFWVLRRLYNGAACEEHCGMNL